MTNSPRDSKATLRSPDRPRLIVWQAGGHIHQPVLRALSQRFETEQKSELPDPGAVDPSPHELDLLLLCNEPSAALYEAMSQDQSPRLALQTWRHQTLDILQLKRRNQQKVHILHTDAIALHPVAFLHHFELPAGTEQIAELAGLESAVTDDDILRLIAWQIVREDAEMRDLQKKLKAASTSFSDATKGISADPDAAFSAYRNAFRCQHQIELLQAQNRAMFAELETLQNSRIQIQQTLEDVAQNLESRNIEVEALRTEKAGIQTKLVDKDRSLQAAGDIIQELEFQSETLMKDVERSAEAEKKLRQIQRSKSYRLTAPLRRVGGLVSRRIRS